MKQNLQSHTIYGINNCKTLLGNIIFNAIITIIATIMPRTSILLYKKSKVLSGKGKHKFVPTLKVE